MLTASILAKKGDIPVHTVRHYTKLELLKPAIHSQNGYKIHKHSDKILLRFIRTAKDLGFSLTKIRQILDVAVWRRTDGTYYIRKISDSGTIT